MSDCDEFRPLITALLDRELSVGDAARVEEHLKVCEPCAHVFAECGKLQNAAGMAHLPQAANLWDRISDEISDEPATILAEEMRLMRQEMKALRAEVVGLRRELAQRQAPQYTRSTALSVPDALPPSYKQFRLV